MQEIIQSKKTLMNPESARYVSEAMDDIFDILKGFYTGYGSVLKTTSIETAIRQQWIYEINGSRVNEDMLRMGMSRAKAHSLEDKFCKWPSIMDFISWCHGIPSPEAAYFETSRNCHDLTEWEPTHPIVALAGSHTGFYDIRNNDNQKYYKSEYTRVYCELLTRILAGETFTYSKLEKPLKIEKSEPTEEDKQRNKEMLSELMASLETEDVQTEKPKDMTQEEKKERLAEMREKAEAWNKTRGEK